MAYPSKAERLETWRYYRHREWIRSLAEKPTAELLVTLEAIRARLERNPKRHIYVAERLRHNIIVLQAEINKRSN